ncbi:MAG: PEP-CTERM sorting domain-containing protein [Kiritimatiellae bacterium]|nr:PEP-CTERM sorting domain-containing protein [Kiritimatiellia bacterium]
MLNPVVPSGFNFGSHLVPEPTSGLLMMLGAGLLALRRRRRA